VFSSRGVDKCVEYMRLGIHNKSIFDIHCSGQGFKTLSQKFDSLETTSYSPLIMN